MPSEELWPRQRPAWGSLDRQLCQQALDCDQPRDIRSHRLAELPARLEQDLVALGAADLEHLRVLGLERALGQRHLDDAAQPGGVQGDLLQPGVAVSVREGLVNVLIPQPAERNEVLRSLLFQAPAFSCAMTASATWLVPTAVGSPRFSFKSYVTFSPRAITREIAPSIASAASTSSRWRSISTPDSITAIGLTLF